MDRALARLISFLFGIDRSFMDSFLHDSSSGLSANSTVNSKHEELSGESKEGVMIGSFGYSCLLVGEKRNLLTFKLRVWFKGNILSAPFCSHGSMTITVANTHLYRSLIKYASMFKFSIQLNPNRVAGNRGGNQRKERNI